MKNSAFTQILKNKEAFFIPTGSNSLDPGFMH